MKVDFRRLVTLMLPEMLRRDIHIAWLMMLMAPMRTVYGFFLGKRETNLYVLSITPQVCFLEKMLNDRYDPDARRIFIQSASSDRKYLYRADEQKYLYLYLPAETEPVYIYSPAELLTADVDFMVCVPHIAFNEAEMRALLDSYKLAGVNYALSKEN
jgi:hypothetical protein